MHPQSKSETFDLPSGTMLGGKYELLRRLATGGMAEIYLARTRGTANFEKLVVVKRILPSVADDPDFVRMFFNEARLAATLRHPNIADVYEVGEEDGAPFFAMEFIHGQDLRAIRSAAHAQKELVPVAVSLAVIHAIASALDYAHELRSADGKPIDLVHRDVTASNILVSYEGAIRLIDFGIARVQSAAQQTQIGTLKGKIPYMSPEQCRGLALDRRSDLFSLGVCLYEITVGQRPFTGDNDFMIMDKIVHRGAQAPSELIRNYPPELERIVMRLLARKPEDRYESAEALLHDLDHFIAQHRLHLSAKAMSRYMRTQFADKLAGGVEDPDAITRHMLSTITAQSQLMTPPSSFPAVLPASQEMAALGIPMSEPFAKPSVSEVMPVARAQPAKVLYPELKPAGGRWLVVLLGLAVLGAGAYFGLEFLKQQQAAGDEPGAKVEPAAAPVVEAPKPEPASPAAAPVVEAPKPEAASAPAVQPDAAEPAPEPATEREPTISDVKITDVKTPPPKPKKKRAKSKPEPKVPDRTWDKDDADSPFLP